MTVFDHFSPSSLLDKRQYSAMFVPSFQPQRSSSGALDRNRVQQRESSVKLFMSVRRFIANVSVHCVSFSLQSGGWFFMVFLSLSDDLYIRVNVA